MGILISIIIGFFIGAVAKLLMPGKDPGGFIVTSLIGIAGSVVANYVGRQMGHYDEMHPAGFFASVVGAMLLLFLYRAVSGKRA